MDWPFCALSREPEVNFLNRALAYTQTKLICCFTNKTKSKLIARIAVLERLCMKIAVPIHNCAAPHGSPLFIPVDAASQRIVGGAAGLALGWQRVGFLLREAVGDFQVGWKLRHFAVPPEHLL